MKQRRPKQFSVTKAVKRNARERVGTPPPPHILPNTRDRAERRGARHRQNLRELLRRAED